MKRMLAFFTALFLGLATSISIIQPKMANAATNSLCVVYQGTILYQTSPTACASSTPSPVAQSVATAPVPSPSPSLLCAPPFSAPNAYPDACFKPYTANSVWNTASAVSASPDPNSATWMSYYIAHFPFFSNLSFGLKNELNQYGHPIYFGHSTDQVYNVKCLATWSSCVGAQTFHVPSYAIPAEGSDHHFTVIDEANGNVEIDLWGADKPSGTGGTLTAQAAGSGNLITSDGLVFGQTGAGYAQWAGIIRSQELIAGSINHALFMVAPCTNNNAPVFPSNFRGTDTQCANNQGAPYGAWMRLNLTTAQILALGAPLYIDSILFAAQQYGAFLGDTNGNGSFGFQVEADEMYTAPGYKNANCPTNGGACTPLTAWSNVNYPNLWNGSAYVINLSSYVQPSAWQFIDSPPGK